MRKNLSTRRLCLYMKDKRYKKRIRRSNIFIVRIFHSLLPLIKFCKWRQERYERSRTISMLPIIIRNSRPSFSSLFFRYWKIPTRWNNYMHESIPNTSNILLNILYCCLCLVYVLPSPGEIVLFIFFYCSYIYTICLYNLSIFFKASIVNK